MSKLEDELNYLEEKGKTMEQDSEMKNMQATVSGMRMRLKTMRSEAGAKKTEIEVIFEYCIF